MFTYMQKRSVFGMYRKNYLALIIISVFMLMCLTGITVFNNAAYIIDGENTSFVLSSKESPEEILADNGYFLGENDTISVSGHSQGILNIEILKAVSITVTADGSTKEAFSFKNGDTVAKALEKANIKVSKNDIVTPSLDTVITQDTEITVKRITTKEVTKSVEIPYSKTTVESDKYAKGTSFVSTAGVTGSKDVTMQITYCDNEETTRETINEVVTKPAVNEVTTIGTAETRAVAANAATVVQTTGPAAITSSSVISPAPASVQLDENGLPVKYSGIITGKTSAYTSSATAHVSCGQTAAIGLVAVNPNVIPYGTRMYIVAADGTAYGYAIAADTGGALMSGKVSVDLYMGANNDSACYQWGIRNANIYILD